MGDNDFATGYALGSDSGNNNNGFLGGEGLWAILIFAMILLFCCRRFQLAWNTEGFQWFPRRRGTLGDSHFCDDLWIRQLG